MIEDFLAEFGLSEKEIAAYLALLKIGPNPVNNIARQAKLSRTTTYSVLGTLKEKELVTIVSKQNVQYYTAKRPETFLSLLDRRVRNSNLQKQKLNQILPELRLMISNASRPSRVQFFEGFSGIKNIYEDMLKSNAKVKYAFSPALDVSDPVLAKYLDEYVAQRVKQNMKAKVVFPDSAASRLACAKDAELLRESRLVPAEKFPFQSEVNIYSNKVAFVSFNTNNLHGLIVESDEISLTLKSVFELAWIGAKVV